MTIAAHAIRESYYANPCIQSKISQVLDYKKSITLLILPICLD